MDGLLVTTPPAGGMKNDTMMCLFSDDERFCLKVMFCISYREWWSSLSVCCLPSWSATPFCTGFLSTFQMLVSIYTHGLFSSNIRNAFPIKKSSPCWITLANSMLLTRSITGITITILLLN